MPTVVPDRFHPRGEALVAGARPMRVFGGLPGEEAEVRVTHRGGNEDYAEWTRAIRASPERVAPPCPHYRRCGGCPWMHLEAGAAREWRRRRVADALAEAGIHVDVDPTVPCPDGDFGYRHVVKLVAREGRLGAYGRHSHELVGIGGCGVLAPALRPFTMLLPPASLRHLVVRRSRSSGALLATVIAWRDDFALRRFAASLPVDGVHLHLNDAPGDAIFGRGPTERLHGVETIDERIGDTTLAIGPADFFQTNPATAARLWADLPRPDGALLDLFCGVGAVALTVGRGVPPLGGAGAAASHPGPRLPAPAGPIHGVELSEAAVTRARANAARNGIAATFAAGPVATAEIPPGFEGATIVVNPPRAGLGEAAVARVVALRPRRIAYVSCEPRTLARDLPGLLATGLRIVRVTPYDMFPQTPHVETVVVLG